MTPPPGMPCSFPECEFVTPPSVPSYELVIKTLELHINAAHGSRSNPGTNPMQSKVEKPKRPTVSANMSESDWVFFEHKWKRYQRQSGISGQQLIDELWACLDQDLERLAFQDGMSHTNHDDLLAAVKALAVTTVHPALHVVSLHETKQLSGETIKAFCARVRGIAQNCKLEKECSKSNCSEKVSFTEETCFHVVLTGLIDEDIREKVLTQAMVGTVKDLPTLIEYVVAEESAKHKSPPRNLAAIQNKHSRHYQSQKCLGCGSQQHGSYNRNRAKSCKAYGKTCSKCGKPNHYASLCKSAPTSANSIETQDV